MSRLHFSWYLLVLPFLLAAAPARANITVKGTVYYWNGDAPVGNETHGTYSPARRTRIQVENDQALVGDIDTWTDVNGRYEVTFRQKAYRPDFSQLNVNVEVRTSVLLATLKRTGPDDEVKVSCYKGAVRMYPYNGQTDKIRMADGSTWTINVYVGTEENAAPPETADANTRNLKITSWDYDDDGRRTVAGLFMCQACRDEYVFLTNRAASAKDVSRETSIFYPESGGAAYRPGQSPPGTGWIDMGNEDRSGDDKNQYLYRLFPKDHPADSPWLTWRTLRCTMMHEFAHKLMHDVYWTMPKSMPWGEGIPLLEGEPSQHDLTTCRSEELGWVEGWADFLPAAVLAMPTLCGQPVVTDTIMAPGAPGEPATPVVSVVQDAPNLEHAWYPELPEGTGERTKRIPGDTRWHDQITGERLFNEGEVAAVLWDIYDPRGWEYLSDTKQRRRPEGWPSWLRWYDQIGDSDLAELWAILKQEPECLNDETESESFRDSVWTFWLQKYQVEDRTPLATGPYWLTEDRGMRMAHGLKAILHNRGLQHRLLPENDPEILSVTGVGHVGSVSLVEVVVRETDIEDREFLFYNIAYANGDDPLRLMYEEDQPFRGPRHGDEVTVRIALPPADTWNRLILLVHDSMEPDFLDNRDNRWQKTSDSTKPSMPIIAAGGGCCVCWRPDGSVWTWGYNGPRGNTHDNGSGKSRTEWHLIRTTPIVTDGVQNAIAVAVGGQHSMAIAADGTVWTWGYNESGAAGIGSDKAVISSPRTTVNQVEGLTEVVAIAAGGNTSLALRTDGTVWAWGTNEYGSLGIGRATQQEVSPVQIPNLFHIVAIAMGIRHGLAVDSDGAVWAWGGNDMGQLGDGTTEDRDHPVRVLGLPGKAVAVAAHHHHHSLALCEDGTVWEWGELRNADKFNRTVRSSPRPKQVAGLPTITAIAAGGGHFLALDNTERVWAWGGNTYGQLGDGTQTSRWPVIPVTDLNNVIAIAAGSGYSVAVRRDGTIWTWGSGLSGALGNGSSDNQSKPVQVQTFVRIRPKDLRETVDAFHVFPFRLF